MENGRICTKCKTFKEYTHFHRCNKVKSGYESRCKECSNKELKRYRDANREKVRAEQRKYYHKNKERCIANTMKYRNKNKQKFLQYNKEYNSKNKELLNAKCRRNYHENKEQRKEMQRKWYLKNKDRAYSRVLKRRSLKHSVAFVGVKRKEILDRDNWTCQACEVRVHDRNEGGNENRHLWDDEFKAHIDHIIPISKGGDSTLENLRVLCRTCNLSKSDKTDLSINNSGQISFEI